MKLSVCIFTYNHERYIGQAIEGALSQQTDFDFEIVIGEDCSTDSTREIVKRYQELHPQKIRALLNADNLGMMANNSHTIKQGEGEYIAIMDGDDYWTCPEKLKAQVDFLDNNPEYVLCFHNAFILDLDGRIDENKTCCGDLHKSKITLADVIYDVSIPTSSLVFRKSALDGYPPVWFNQLNAPDRPLFLMLLKSGPGYYIDQTWGVYRKHLEGTWTGQHYQSRWLTFLQIYRIMNPYFNYLYDREFRKSEARVYYILAIRLIKDKMVKKAICMMRKYITLKSRRHETMQPLFLVNLIRFYIRYLLAR
jgi:glycosyltransferase involved in cell wall biosynthesis